MLRNESQLGWKKEKEKEKCVCVCLCVCVAVEIQSDADDAHGNKADVPGRMELRQQKQVGEGRGVNSAVSSDWRFQPLLLVIAFQSKGGFS